MPFIVIFCQIIETRDRADLERLQAFVTSINYSESPMMSDGETDAVVRIRKLFQVLSNVASHYVDAHAAGVEKRERESGSIVSNIPGQTATTQEIDSYLATLGFPAQGADYHGHHQHVHPEEPAGVNPMLWMGNGTQLEDWFYSNQQMMEFLEDGNLGGP